MGSVTKMLRASRRTQGGQALILSLLAVIVIIAIASSVIYPRMAGRNEYDSHGNVQGPATPIDRANDAACTVYMQQVTAAAVEYRQDHNAPAPSLEALKPYGVTEDIINTPDCSFGLPKYAPAVSRAPVTITSPGAAPAPSANTGQPYVPPGMHSVTVGPGVAVHLPNGSSSADTGDGQ